MAVGRANVVVEKRSLACAFTVTPSFEFFPNGEATRRSHLTSY